MYRKHMTLTKHEVKFKSRDLLKTLLLMINALTKYHIYATTWNHRSDSKQTVFISFSNQYAPYFTIPVTRTETGTPWFQRPDSGGRREDARGGHDQDVSCLGLSVRFCQQHVVSRESLREGSPFYRLWQQHVVGRESLREGSPFTGCGNNFLLCRTFFFTTVLSHWDFSNRKFRLLSPGKASCDGVACWVF